MKKVPCRARQLRDGHPQPFEPSALTVKPWHASRPGDTPAVLLQRGRKQFLFDLECALQLADALADTVEDLEAAEDRVQAAFDSRPTYSTGEPL
jgi:hypothetical protein